MTSLKYSVGDIQVRTLAEAVRLSEEMNEPYKKIFTEYIQIDSLEALKNKEKEKRSC